MNDPIARVLTLEEVRGIDMLALRDRLVKRMAATATFLLRSDTAAAYGEPLFVPSLSELGYVAGFLALVDELL